MDKTELLETLEAERLRLESLIGAMGYARMDAPGVSGYYSAKDIVAHITAYERALVTWLREAKAGRAYTDAMLDQPDVDARNASVYEATRHLPVDEVISDFRQTFTELEASVALFTEEELNDAVATSWFVLPRWRRKQPLWMCIADDSYEHHHQHIPDIERWIVSSRPATPP